MAFEEIDSWIRAKRGRAAKVAAALGIEPDKVSKSQNGRREWKAPEVDIVRRLMAEEQGGAGGAVRLVPLLGEVPAGSLREAFKSAKGSVPIDDPSVPARAYALIVSGDSMDEVVPDGARIILDPDDTDLFPGRFYVVLSADGETTFKKYVADPARLVPCSTNKSHAPIVIGREQFTVLARVIGNYSRM